MWPRQESNLNLELRKLLYYPLYYEADAANILNEILVINRQLSTVHLLYNKCGFASVNPALVTMR